MKQARDEKGRYTRKYRQLSRWEKIIVLSFIAAYGLALLMDALVVAVEAHNAPEEVVLEEVVEEPQEVRIELVYTQERIIELIQEAFPHNPVMVQVAKCESGLDQYAYNPTNNSHDRGIFQISRLYHGQKDADMYDVKKNIAYAKKLFTQYGLQPWSASKHCWNK